MLAVPSYNLYKISLPKARSLKVEENTTKVEVISVLPNYQFLSQRFNVQRFSSNFHYFLHFRRGSIMGKHRLLAQKTKGSKSDSATISCYLRYILFVKMWVIIHTMQAIVRTKLNNVEITAPDLESSKEQLLRS